MTTQILLGNLKPKQRLYKKFLKKMVCKTTVEFTVAQKPNHSTIGNRGCNPISGPGVTFWASKK
jgi:hypothetical protein